MDYDEILVTYSQAIERLENRVLPPLASLADYQVERKVQLVKVMELLRLGLRTGLLL